MQRLVEVGPHVRGGNGFVRVHFIEYGLDGMTQLDGPTLAFTRHAALGLLEGLQRALAQDEDMAEIRRLHG